MQQLKKLEHAVSSWPQISVHPHRFAAREFRFGNAEVGHVHDSSIVDIPFPRSIRDALLAEGLALLADPPLREELAELVRQCP